MAPVKSWSTKEEVLQDLARASGRTKNRDDLDERYLVFGNRPPPYIVENEDDEMRQLFGDDVSRKTSQNEQSTPDLEGIQQMLRMVQEFDGTNDDGAVSGAGQNSDCVISISKISKLNPEVKEFVPTSVKSCSSTTNSTASLKTNKNVVTQTVEKRESFIDLNSNNMKLNDEVTKTNKSEYEDMASKLKETISDAAKSYSFEHKKQKNVAIVTLLRLYANNSTSPKKSEEPLKLFPPEYFEGKKYENFNVSNEVLNDATPPVMLSKTPEPKPPSIPTCFNNSTSCGPQETLQDNLNKGCTPEIHLDSEMKQSIEKVNRWLEEEPTKRVSPAVCLGPISFKRKEYSSNTSPVSDLHQTTPKPSNDGRYIPSGYAADLGRKYMARSKQIEERKKDVTWSNLEEVLKEKDLLKKRELQAREHNDESI